MKCFKFNKLVRDKILQHMQSQGQIAHGVKRLDDNEFIKLLIAKIKEEADELATSDDHSIPEELADLQELIDHLTAALGLDKRVLQQLQEKKNEKNGSFHKRIYIESVEVDENSECYNYYKNSSDKYPQIA